MTHTSMRTAFDAVAQDYDSERRLLVPCFDALYGHTVDIVTESLIGQAAPRVIDLGAGTGLLSALLAERLPDATFHLVDLSEGMLDHARQRFDRMTRGRATFEVADLGAFTIAGEWDAVVSALAIHHLSDDVKQRLYQQLPAVIKSGGIFVNAEQVLGPTSQLEAQYEDTWLRMVKALGASEQQIERAKGRMVFDQSSPLRKQLDWLQDAGFSQVDCVFKEWRFAVIAAWVDN